MGYRDHPVPARWRGLAECLWTSTASGPYDVLPDGCMDLVWTGTQLLVAGPGTAPHPHGPPDVPSRGTGKSGTGAAGAAGLRFRPGVLPALLGTPAADLRDTRVAAELLTPAPARRATGLRAAGVAPGPVLARLAAALPG